MPIEIKAHGAEPALPKGRVVGIDLGTTNSLVAWVGDDGRPSCVDGPGGRLVPSVVAFGEGGGRMAVGVAAADRLVIDPDRTVYSVKRLMGRSAEDVRDELKFLPYHVLREDVSRRTGAQIVRIDVDGHFFTPPELSAMVLRELKLRAEGAFGEPVTRAVITVPAYFNDAQRQATKDAGRIAGLEVLRIVNEPTAAALAYGLDKRHEGTIAVYDFGGGTFDVSILKVNDGLFEVLSTAGDTHLGGDDIDHVLMDRVLDRVREARGIDLAEDREAVQTIRKAVIAAKCALSFDEVTQITIALEGRLDVPLTLPLDRATFDGLAAPIIDRTIGPCQQAIADARLSPAQIDEVILVGGSTRIPLVRRRVEEVFGKPAHCELDPDEVVALGAAVQADILTTGRRDMLLLDVTPLSLGIETMGDVVARIIHRNSTIPASATEEFTTWVDGQTGVVIHVLQGEREFVKDCRSLARFTIQIPPMPAGLPRIAVTFLIDANGILHVTGRDVRTGHEHTIEVRPSYGLTDDEVEKMLLDAFENAEADLDARMFVEARTEAESVLAALDKALRDTAAEELSSIERAEIQSRIARLRATLEGTGHQAVRDALALLNRATHHLAELMMDSALKEALRNKRLQAALEEKDELDDAQEAIASAHRFHGLER